MRDLKEVLYDVQEIDMSYYQNGEIKQFTIDLIEHLAEELNSCFLGESDLPEETILGGLSYKVSTALEVCDKTLPDFHVMQKLYDTTNK